MSSAVPNVQVGQVWEDCDPRAKGRLVLVLRLPAMDVPNPGEGKVMVEVLRSRDKAGGPEDARTRGRRRSIKLRRFRPISTGYRLVEDPEVIAKAKA